MKNDVEQSDAKRRLALANVGVLAYAAVTLSVVCGTMMVDRFRLFFWHIMAEFPRGASIALFTNVVCLAFLGLLALRSPKSASRLLCAYLFVACLIGAWINVKIYPYYNRGVWCFRRYGDNSFADFAMKSPAAWVQARRLHWRLRQNFAGNDFVDAGELPFPRDELNSFAEMKSVVRRDYDFELTDSEAARLEALPHETIEMRGVEYVVVTDAKCDVYLLRHGERYFVVPASRMLSLRGGVEK